MRLSCSGTRLRAASVPVYLCELRSGEVLREGYGAGSSHVVYHHGTTVGIMAVVRRLMDASDMARFC